MKRILAIILTVFCLTAPYTGFADTTDGKWDHILGPSARSMSAIVYGKGVFVQVGDGGTILVSSDGKQWTVVDSPTTMNLRKLDFNGERFVATGIKGTVMTSDDGRNWSLHPRYSNSDVAFTGIAWDGSKYLATSDYYGGIYTSVDGATWTFHQRLFQEKYDHFRSLIWDGKRFIGLKSGYLSVQLYMSTDGLEWTRLDFTGTKGISDASDIAYDGNVYVVSGASSSDVYVSKDLKQFKAYKASNFGLSRIKFSGGMFIGLATEYRVEKGWHRGGISVSKDGMKWRIMDDLSKNTATDIASNGSVHVASMRDFALTFEEHFGSTLYSEDLSKWKEYKRGSQEAFVSLASNGKVHVAGNSQGFVCWSTDGTTWKRVDLSGIAPISKVIWDGKKFIAVGSGIQTSPDGMKWKDQPMKLDFSKSPKHRSFVMQGNKFVNRISDILFDGKRYVAVGEWGLLMTSTDLVNWKAQKTDSFKWIETVATNGKYIVANGSVDAWNDALVYSSKDGVAWKKTIVKGMSTVSVRSNGAGFVMAGTVDRKTGLYTSTDGVTWKRFVMDHEEMPYALAYTGNEYICSTRLAVFKSTDGVTWTDITPSQYFAISPKDALRIGGTLYVTGLNGYLSVIPE